MSEIVLFSEGGATEAKQDSILVALAGLESTTVTVSNPTTGFATQSTLAAVLGALQGTLAVSAATLPLPNGASTLSAQVDLLAQMAVLESKLNDIFGAVDGLEITAENISISSDAISLNTDEVESLLRQVRDRLPSIIGQLSRSTSLSVALSTEDVQLLSTLLAELQTQQKNALTNAEIRLTPLAVSAVDLDIRNLVFATDKVDASGSAVSVTNFPTELAVFGRNTLSNLNSTSAALAGNATFLGAFEDVSSYAGLSILLRTDQNSATNGASLEWSDDGITVRRTSSSTVVASATQGYFFYSPRQARYFRTRYVNGATAQTLLIVQIIKDAIAQSSSIIPVLGPIDTAASGQLVRSVVAGQTTAGGGGFVNVKVNPSGALTVEATADNLDIRNLVFASDKVDASGSSVTVSNFPVTQPVSGPLTDAQLRATPVPVSGSLTVTPSADPQAITYTELVSRMRNSVAAAGYLLQTTVVNTDYLYFMELPAGASITTVGLRGVRVKLLLGSIDFGTQYNLGATCTMTNYRTDAGWVS